MNNTAEHNDHHQMEGLESSKTAPELPEAVMLKEPKGHPHIGLHRSPIADIIEREIKSMASKNKPVLIAKIAIIFIFLIANFLHTRKFAAPRKSVECIKDSIFELTQSINDKLNSDTKTLNVLQISSSMLVDLADVATLYGYWKSSDNVRLPIQLIVFYVTRGIIQNIFLFRHPRGTIWPFPGIPSITVPYGITADYYFSGHCGFLTLMAFENYRQGRTILAAIIAVCAWYVGFVLVVARVHYSIDIPVGMMTGAWAHYIVHTYIRQIQRVLRRGFNRCCWLKMKFYSEI